MREHKRRREPGYYPPIWGPEATLAERVRCIGEVHRPLRRVLLLLGTFCVFLLTLVWQAGGWIAAGTSPVLLRWSLMLLFLSGWIAAYRARWAEPDRWVIAMKWIGALGAGLLIGLAALPPISLAVVVFLVGLEDVYLSAILNGSPFCHGRAFSTRRLAQWAVEEMLMAAGAAGVGLAIGGAARMVSFI